MPEMSRRHKRATRGFFSRSPAGAAELPRRRKMRQRRRADLERGLMEFASDNGAGVAPEILEAIAASSRVNAPAYGADDYSARATAMLSEVFETKVAALLVAT